MTKPIPNKFHRSVSEMARDLLSGDPDFVAEFETRLSKRQLVKSLSIIRARAKLSQQELASRMGCSQSKISKIESGIDADLRFGDIEAYLKATSHEAKRPRKPTTNQNRFSSTHNCPATIVAGRSFVYFLQ